MKKITRIYTGPDGESHFGEFELPQNADMPGATLPINAKEVWFRENEGSSEGSWHNAPCRLMYLMLGGSLELECADGSKRLFKAGDVFLAEDTTGRGHLSRAKDRKAALVPLD